jgi:5-methylcytosine-specific restriction protein A
MKIRDLPRPVTAAKSDSTPNGEWIGVTPLGKGPSALAQCEATIRSQMGNGYVLEYVSLPDVKPNPGHETDSDFLKMKQRHKDEAGSLLAIARLGACQADRTERVRTHPAEMGKRRRRQWPLGCRLSHT